MIGLTKKQGHRLIPFVSKPAPKPSSGLPAEGDLSAVDTNGNGKVTIKEAKDVGYKMPIYKDHWLYKYMDDRDGDGMVGEQVLKYDILNG